MRMTTIVRAVTVLTAMLRRTVFLLQSSRSSSLRTEVLAPGLGLQSDKLGMLIRLRLASA